MLRSEITNRNETSGKPELKTGCTKAFSDNKRKWFAAILNTEIHVHDNSYILIMSARSHRAKNNGDFSAAGPRLIEKVSPLQPIVPRTLIFYDTETIEQVC